MSTLEASDCQLVSIRRYINLYISLLPYKHFTRCRVGLPAARVGIMEAKLAACLHPSALQWASGSNEGLSTEQISCKPSLCHWWRQSGGIKLAIGGQNQ